MALMRELESYWHAVRLKVCTKCIDGDGRGNCRLEGEDVCRLKFHFSKIVETVLSVKSDNMEPYIEALKDNVCTYCKHQTPDGKCVIRAHIDCGLDRYFPMIVEAIEEVKKSFVDEQSVANS